MVGSHGHVRMRPLETPQGFGALIAHCYYVGLVLRQEIANDVRPPITISNDSDTNDVAAKTSLQRETRFRRSVNIEAGSHPTHLDFLDCICRLLTTVARGGGYLLPIQIMDRNEEALRYSSIRTIAGKDCTRRS